MFESLSRSWGFAMTSYRILWAHKRLLILPLLSGLAGALVVASFVAPLWWTGTLDQWLEGPQAREDLQHNVALYVGLFLFYFCNYFVIVFFNSALISCVMQSLNGEEPAIGRALAVSAARFPQIVGWALVSAFVGVLLKVVENAHERAAQWIAAILGTAWSAMTYFVVPVIVLEGVGPITAVKQSLGILKRTWGTALVGNFSLGLVGLLILLPIYLVAIGLFVLGAMSGSVAIAVGCIALAAVLFVLATITNSAAGTVFTAVLYNYATGRSVPAGIDDAEFSRAFVAKE